MISIKINVHQPRQHLKIYLWMLSALWLSGCMSQVNIPEDHYYRLPDISSQKIMPQNRNEATPSVSIINSLSVARFQMSGLPNTRAILYIDPVHPSEVKQYYYRHWVESPEKLIQESLLSYLAATGIAVQVTPANENPNAQYRVQGKIMRFERVMEGNEPKIVVKITIALNSTMGTYSTKTYQTEIISKNTTMDASISAFGTALSRIFQSIAEDLKTIQPKV
jgi:ABC-type uncharacterized transport system auxiliary subunit